MTGGSSRCWDLHHTGQVFITISWYFLNKFSFRVDSRFKKSLLQLPHIDIYKTSEISQNNTFYFRLFLFSVYVCDFMQMYFVRNDEINMFNQSIILQYQLIKT